MIMKELADYKYALDESAIVAITDPKGIIIHANDNFCKISKYSREELIGKDHRIINSGFHPKEFIEKLWRTISGGQIWRGEIKNRAKDGSVYWVDTTIVPFLDQSGVPYQYIAIRSDITARKQAEEVLVKYSHEMEHKNTQLVDFCNIVSHNLRGPLVNISMLVEFMNQSESDVDRRMVQSKIKPVVAHLMEVFDELIESIQVQQDTDLISDPIDLKECIGKILIGFDAQMREYQGEIHLDFDHAPEIIFPQKYAESIFLNLISNALKYRSPDRSPVIQIRSQREGSRVVMSFSDNGLGIDLNLHRNHIFKIRKIFHRHPDAKGFGLFMTRTQIEAMGGRIWVKSEVNAGSTFFVEFENQNL